MFWNIVKLGDKQLIMSIKNGFSNLPTDDLEAGEVKTLIALAIDVYYKTDGLAKAVGVIFDALAAAPARVITCFVNNVPDYEPGAFYKRELPCIQAVLNEAKDERIDMIIIDGYVYLGEYKPGLGDKLWQSINRSTPVIGVAKTSFSDAADNVMEVYRGESGKPLYVSAAGIGLEEAALIIKRMPGEFRIPTILKHLDVLTKQ